MMAWSSISLLAAFLLVASSSAAPANPLSKEELCKGSPDADYCDQFLVIFAPSDFNSESWHKAFTMYASMASKAGEKWAVDRSQGAKGQKHAADLKTCLQNFHDNIKLAEAGKYDAAATKMDDCINSLRHQYHDGDAVQMDVVGVMTEAERLAKFYRTASYVLKKATKA